MNRDEQAMRHRIEARTERQPQQSTPRPAFDSSVRQADAMGVGRYQVTERTAAGVTTYAAIGRLGALLDAAYDGGAMGVSAMVAP